MHNIFVDNELTVRYRRSHIKRLETNKCKVHPGILFVDFLTNFERIADHLNNIAEEKSGALAHDD